MPIQSTDAVNQQAPVKRLRMQDQRSSQMTGYPECMSWPGEMCSDEVDFGGNFVCQVVSRCAEILPLPIRLQLLKSALLCCCVTIRSEQQPQWRLRYRTDEKKRRPGLPRADFRYSF